MMAKRLFYICAGILCLMVAYHLGARNAGAQAGNMVTGFAAQPGVAFEQGGGFYVLTSNGDVYARYMAPGGGSHALSYFGNFWSGLGPTAAQQESFGSLKAKYHK
jgi:hypothetical protein